MADGFDLTARMVLQAPTNINSILNDIRAKFKDIPANIKLTFDQNGLKQFNTTISQIESSLVLIKAQANDTSRYLSSLSSNMGKVSSSSAQADAGLKRTQETLKATSTELKTADDLMNQFGRTAGLAGRRFLGYSLAAGSVISLVVALKSGITEALHFQKELVKLEQVGVGSKAELKDIADEVTRLSISLGVSSKELIGVANTLKQAGYSAAETRDILKTVAEASLAPSFSSMADTTETAISAIQQFNISAKELHDVMGSVNAVSNEFAVEAKDIGDAIRRAGGSFKAVGGDVNELIALFTSVRATTRESAEGIATGLRTIFTRLQRPELIENLKELGINLRFTREEAAALGNVNLERQFVGGYEAIQRIGVALKGISTTDPRFSVITEQLGGYRQISKVIPLLQQQEIQQKALNVAQAGSISLTTSAEQAQNSYLQSLSKIKEEFLAIFRTITDNSAFKQFLDTIATALTLFNQLLKVVEKITPLLISLGTIKLGSLVGSSSFLGGISTGFLRGNPVATRASGGLIPGTGNTDTVSAMLTPGEYVMQKSAVQRIGVANLERANKGSLRAFASGGFVGRDEETGRFKSFPLGLTSPNYLDGPRGTQGGSPYLFNKPPAPSARTELEASAALIKQAADQSLEAARKQQESAKLYSGAGKLITDYSKVGSPEGHYARGDTYSVGRIPANRSGLDDLVKEGQRLNLKNAAAYGLLPQEGSPKADQSHFLKNLGPGVRRTPLEPNFLTDEERAIGEGKFQPGDLNPKDRTGFQKFKGALSNPLAGIVGAAAVSYASDSINNNFLPINDSAGTGTVAGRGATGALSGAAQGAATGGILGGPLGVAIGATVGGLYGLYTALTETSSKIKEAKIDSEMGKFSQSLKLANDGLVPLAGVITELSSNIGRRRGEALEGAKSSATSILGGTNYTTLGNELSKNLRQRFNNDLPGIFQTLGSSARKLGEENPSKSFDELKKTLIDGNEGLNREFLRLIADMKQITITQAAQEFKKATEEGIKAAQLAKQEATIREVGLRSIQSLGRVASITQEAGAHAEEFNITAGASPFSVNSNFGNLHNPSSNSFLGSVSQVTSAFGNNAKDIDDTSKAYKDTFTNLAPVLQQLLKTGGLQGKEIGTETRDIILQRLGETDKTASPELLKVLSEVSSNINKGLEQNPGQFIEKVKFNIDSVIKDNIVPTFKDFAQVLSSASKDINDQLNKLATGLSENNRRINAILQEQFELAKLTLEKNKVEAEFTARAAGRPGQGIQFLGVGQLQAPFNQKQNDLLGGNFRNNDSEGIAARIKEIQNNLLPIARQGSNNLININDREEAVKTKTSLELEADRLTQALRNLADPTLRIQGLFEKLNDSLKRNQAITDVGTSLFAASPRERGKLVTGAAIAEQVQQRGFDLNKLNQAQRDAFLNFTRFFENINLPKFGGLTGKDLREKAVNESLPPGLKGLFGGNKAEQGGLEGGIKTAFKEAEEARKQLIELEKNQQERFYDNLKNIFSNFVNDLKVLDLERNKAGLEGQRTLEGNKGVDLKKKADAADLLKAFGFNQNQVTALAGKNDKLGGFLQEQTSFADRKNENVNAGIDIQGFLKGQNFDSIENALKAIDRIDKVAPGFLSQKDKDRLTGEATLNKPAGDLNKTDAAELKATLITLVDKITGEKNSIVTGEQNKSFADTKALTGVDFQGKSLNDIKAIVDNINTLKVNPQDFTNASVELRKVNDNIGELTAKIQRFNEAIEAAKQLNIPVGGPKPNFGLGAPILRAGGGMTPRGTDTVPAMLTPGEFVINAKSAAANSDLVQHINAAHGPVYLADGGLSDFVNKRAAVRAKALEGAGISVAGLNPAQISRAATEHGGRDFNTFAGDRVFFGPPSPTFKPIRQRPRPVQGPRQAVEGPLRAGSNRPLRPTSFDGPGSKVPGADIINRLKSRPRFDATYVNAKSQSAYASGGFVQPVYRADGGGIEGSSGDVSGLSTLGSLFSNASSVFSSAVNSFAQSGGRLTEALSRFPSSISGSFTHTVNVVINGQEALQQMMPVMENLVISQTKQILNKYISEHIPDAGRIHE